MNEGDEIRSAAMTLGLVVGSVLLLWSVLCVAIGFALGRV